MISSKRFVGFLFALSLVPQLASADEPIAPTVQRRVESGILEPLAQQDKARPRFSRTPPPPRARRVRVTQDTVTADVNGQGFVPFAIEQTWDGSTWNESFTGCAYPKTGALYVKIGSDFRPSDILLGKDAPVAAGVCAAKPTTT